MPDRQRQGATGQDTTFAPDSLSSDPLFVSTTDLHIQSGSPAKDAGTTIAAVTNDFDGEARPGGPAYDIEIGRAHV